MEIKSSKNEVNEKVSQLKDAKTFFQENILCPTDDDTTLSVNAKSKKSYADSQKLIAMLGQNIDKEAENMKSIGEKLNEYDIMLTDLWKDGYRYSTISAGE